MTTHDPFGAFVDRCDCRGGKGPLSGVRLAVKDNIAVAGLAWTAGLPLLAMRFAERDAPCVAALREAGATIVGTTVTDAAGFGMLTPGVTNPIASGYSVGGSSGGSAAAVAGGIADIALGTDTGGSVRVPAACCGLFGLKPTYGRISVDGVTPLSHAFDHVGLMARDIDMLMRGAEVLLPHASAKVHPPQRLGYDPRRLAEAHPVTRTAIEDLLCRLAAEGHSLVEVELPDPVALAEVHGAIVCAEALAIWRDHWPARAGSFAEQARTGLAYAQMLKGDTIEEARAALPVVRSHISRCFDEADAVIGATIAVPPPREGAHSAHYLGEAMPIVFALLAETCTFNVSGHPALSMPLPTASYDGIPVALQIAARHDAEATAFALAQRIGHDRL